MQVMNSDNTTFNPDVNNSIINTGLHIILTTDEDDARPVYISGNFQLSFYINLQKGIGVK
jgi:hypothetical protein